LHACHGCPIYELLLAPTKSTALSSDNAAKSQAYLAVRHALGISIFSVYAEPTEEKEGQCSRHSKPFKEARNSRTTSQHIEVHRRSCGSLQRSKGVGENPHCTRRAPQVQADANPQLDVTHNVSLMKLLDVSAAGCAAAATWNPFIHGELLFALNDGCLYSILLPRVRAPHSRSHSVAKAQVARPSLLRSSVCRDKQKESAASLDCKTWDFSCSGLLTSTAAVQVTSAVDDLIAPRLGSMSVACAGHARRVFLCLAHRLYSVQVRLFVLHSSS
jgi:hypothetical protein